MTSHDAGERIIDMDALHSPYAGAIRVRGVVYKVRHLDGLGYRFLQRVDALRQGAGGTADDLDASYRVVIRHLERVGEDGTTTPATDEEVLGFTPMQIGSVLAVAKNLIPKVEATVPKSSARRAKKTTGRR